MSHYQFYKSADYLDFLVNEIRIDINSAKSYLSYINGVEKYLGTLNLENRRDKVTYVNDIIDSLASSDVEQKYHITRKYIDNWKSALNKYVQFLGQEQSELTEPELSNNTKDIFFEPQAQESYTYSKKDLYDNFTNRIITQDRLYPPIYFHISLIKKVFYKKSKQTKLFFNNWIKEVEDNIILLTHDNQYRLKDITSLTIVFEGDLPTNYIEVNGKKQLLYTHTADNRKVQMRKSKLRDIVLDHIEPISKILCELNSELNGLKILTNKIATHIDSQSLRNSARAAGNLYLDQFLDNNTLIELLRDDLERLKPRTILELMCANENSRKSDK